jgi:hypothetical protein
MKKDLPMKSSRHAYRDTCGGLSDVFVCMRGAAGGIRIHTNTKQRRRPNQSPTMVLAHSPQKIFTKHIPLALPHRDANFSLLGNYRLLVEK